MCLDFYTAVNCFQNLLLRKYVIVMLFFVYSDVRRLRLCCDHLRTESFCRQKAEQPAGTCYCVVKRTIWTDLTYYYKLKMVPSHWNDPAITTLWCLAQSHSISLVKDFITLIWGVFDLNQSKLMFFLYDYNVTDCLRDSSYVF